MQIQPYLFFDGRCEEAAAFYARSIGAEVTMLMRFKEAPPADAAGEGCVPNPQQAEKVMHMAMRIGEATVLASDGHCSGNPDFKGFALSLIAKDEDEAGRKFHALAEGGQIGMPLGKTFFSPAFGMVTDRFGVMWMVIVQ